MKSKVLPVLLLAVLQLNSNHSFAGPGVSGGGDEYAIRFTEVAHQVEDWILANSSLLPQKIDLELLKLAVQTTTIESTDQALTLQGATKDALNFPDAKRIVFNRAAWDRIKSTKEKQALVFHELLGIMRLPDTHYEVSSSILKSVQIAEQKLSCDAVYDFLQIKPNQNDLSLCEQMYFGRLIENGSASKGPKILFFGNPSSRKSTWYTCLIDLKAGKNPSAEVVNCSVIPASKNENQD